MSQHPAADRDECDAPGRSRPRRSVHTVESGTSPSQPAEQTRLRDEVLEKLWKLGGAKLVSQLVQLFSDTAPPRMAAIRAGIGATDSDVVEREAHALKASAGNLGAMKMWALCQRLESQAWSGDWIALLDLIDALEHEFSVVEPHLRAQLEGRQS